MHEPLPHAFERPLEEFRAAAAAWIERNFPDSLRTEAAQNEYYRDHPFYPKSADFQLWKTRMAEKGWNAPGYPLQYGGGGLTPEEGEIVDDELDRIGAFKPAANQGLSLLSPVLLEYGTDEQKQRFLPPIVRAELLFCQGFSEPGAGSDLASLRTRAEDRGDHFVVNGSKIWTSGSMWADWCFCLVRTDPTTKHRGISFLLVDLRSPGIEIRPIELITGQKLFSEVFFNDVAVPRDNMLGELNRGWDVAKRLLTFERSGSRRHRRHLAADERPLHVVARDYGLTDATGRIADPDLRARVIANAMELEAKDILAAHISAQRAAGLGPSAAGSVSKNLNAAITQKREELLVEIMGLQGLGWAGGQFDDNELDTARAMLSNKAMSIFAGSHEIQNNIIAKRILGLPDSKQARQ